MKELQIKLINRVRENSAKGNFDPEVIDALSNKCIKLEKEMEVRFVEQAARFKELRETLELNYQHKK